MWDESVKTTKIMRLENLALYGIVQFENSQAISKDPQLHHTTRMHIYTLTFHFTFIIHYYSSVVCKQTREGHFLSGHYWLNTLQSDVQTSNFLQYIYLPSKYNTVPSFRLYGFRCLTTTAGNTAE